MLYEKYIEQCRKKGISPTAAAVEIGITPGAITKWKKKYEQGQDTLVSVPTQRNMEKFFGMGYGYFTAESFQESELLRYFRQVSNDRRSTILCVARMAYAEERDEHPRHGRIAEARQTLFDSDNDSSPRSDD